MDIQSNWEKALRKTEIVRPRIKPLATFEDTELPYIFLAHSIVNKGDTVVRKGKVLAGRPTLLLPHQFPQLFGFEFEKDMGVSEDTIVNFFLLRGVRFPTLKYTNESATLDLIESGLGETKNKFATELQRKEDLETGLLLGPDDSWQFSVLIFVASMMLRTSDSDVRKLLDRFRKDV